MAGGFTARQERAGFIPFSCPAGSIPARVTRDPPGVCHPMLRCGDILLLTDSVFVRHRVADGPPGSQKEEAMAQKNATPSKEQARIIKANGLTPIEWVVLKDLNHSMIIKHRITHEVKLIGKA